MKKAVLFVHGLGGGKGTWGNFEKLIGGDDQLQFSTFFYEYPSAAIRVLPFFQEKYGNIQALSKGLRTYIDHKLDDYDEIVLVGHSLGGLIIRQYLLDQKIASRAIKTKKVVFYAVPQEGAELAKIGSLISFNHRHLKQLCKNSDFLDVLNDQWATTKVENDFEFKVVVAIEDAVVSPQSAKSNFRQFSPEHVSGKDHRSIVKPRDKEDLSFLILRKFLCETIRISKDRPRGSLLFDEWEANEVQGPFFPDARREELIRDLVQTIQQPQSAVRLVGLSGLGKTRTAIEALRQLSDELKHSLVYIDVGIESGGVAQYASRWVSEGFSGILIADNCPVSLHDQLVKVVLRPQSKVSLLTLDSDMEKSGDCKFVELGRLDNEMIKKMLVHKFGGSLPDPDIERIAAFAQGFPQMAILIAEARINEEKDIGTLSDDYIAKKLLWGPTQDRNASDEKILIGCALFDRFGLENGASIEFQYIANHIVNINEADFYSCVKRFAERGLIDQRGRYAQLVPKPLAIRLAHQWWSTTQRQAQEDLINGMPDSMVTSFCDQVEKLDFLPEVKKFTASLCGQQGPFGQAEVILSVRGSRLFRAFVVVSPEATSSALYRVISSLSHDERLAITGDVRRNLVWALEKLCFHPALFGESAWVLFLLAVAENETWSNNATGMFTQLNRVQLSGTGAKPSVRFGVLRRALELNDTKADLVVLKALQQAINVHGGSRTIGAEYQGTKAPLEEWKPTLWQEIFDFWQEAIDILLEMLNRGTIQREISINTIGHSIRGFVNYGRFDMLDKTIRQVIGINGKYWPAALDSIKQAMDYDGSAIDPEGLTALNNWLDLLKPNDASIEDKLKILVVNPPWEHREVVDGQFVDIAAENAEELAIELGKNIQQLVVFIPLLLSGEQKQTYVFGKRLAIESEVAVDFFNHVLTELGRNENPNQSFARGMLNGINTKSVEKWNLLLEEFSSRKELVKFYPDMMCTGEMNSSQLFTLLDLIRHGELSSFSATMLGYGRVTAHLGNLEISNFCMELSDIDAQGAWTALDILFMYCFSDSSKFEQNRDVLKKLVTKVPLSKKEKSRHSDMYHWEEVAKKLIPKEGLPFCRDLCRQLISATKSGLDHGDIWHSIKPILIGMMQEFGADLWPQFGDAIASASGDQKYWLQQLLDRENSFSVQLQSVCSVVPTATLISWCQENREIGPRFIAGCINVFETVDGIARPTNLFISLLEHFGDDKHVRSALSANLGTRGWSGSLVPYLESDRKALELLLNHSSVGVRTWVKEQISYLENQIKHESMRDDEQGLGIY
jgi:hypothetical protein